MVGRWKVSRVYDWPEASIGWTREFWRRSAWLSSINDTKWSKCQLCTRDCGSGRRWSVNQTAKDVGIPIGSCASILHDVLNMRSFCQRLVPRMLMTEQKVTPTSFSFELIDTADRDNKLLNNIIKGIKRDFSRTIHTQTAIFWMEIIIVTSKQKSRVDRRKGQFMLEEFWRAKDLSIISLSLMVQL